MEEINASLLSFITSRLGRVDAQKLHAQDTFMDWLETQI